MTLNLELDRNLEVLLISAARSHGVAVQEYAVELIRQAMNEVSSQSAPGQNDFPAFLDALAANGSHSRGWQDQTFSRDFIYSDHD